MAVGPEGTVLSTGWAPAAASTGSTATNDTTGTADDTGGVTATARYDPWGNLRRSSGSVPDWRFQGSWVDTSTDLAWAVARKGTAWLCRDGSDNTIYNATRITSQLRN